MPAISFLIPTLNRGDYVLRAVDSCLQTGKMAGLDVQVVVLDSQSDDGSWEALNARFGDSPAVVLAQNKRGLGPTHSWLDAVGYATGDSFTFVWSDDYVADHFASTCFPLLAGSELAMGEGVVRDVDDVSPLPASHPIASRTVEEVLQRFYWLKPGGALSVSPISSLFSRRVLDEWAAVAPIYCQSNELRKQIMWRRAIGPDLMVFLMALGLQEGPVPFVDGYVAQFSSHSDSISIQSPQWFLSVGYWLARLWFAKETLFRSDKTGGMRDIIFARLWLIGIKLMLTMPDKTPVGDRAATRKAIRIEMRDLWNSYAQAGGSPLAALAGGSAGLLKRKLVRV